MGLFSKVILQRKGAETLKKMEVGHSNERIMLEKLSSFVSDISAADVDINGLMEIGLVIKAQRTWLVTYSDAISLIIHTSDYFSEWQTVSNNIANNLESIQNDAANSSNNYYKANGGPNKSVRSIQRWEWQTIGHEV